MSLGLGGHLLSVNINPDSSWLSPSFLCGKLAIGCPCFLMCNNNRFLLFPSIFTSFFLVVTFFYVYFSNKFFFGKYKNNHMIKV